MLFALLKAPVAGVIITLLFSWLIARLEETETFLLLHTINIGSFSIDWSWPVFLVATALSFGVLWMIDP